jgi:hypothetical protein
VSRRRRLDLTGQRFGRLVAMSIIGAGRWACICDCGRTGEFRVSNLRSGKTKSCGCLPREAARLTCAAGAGAASVNVSARTHIRIRTYAETIGVTIREAADILMMSPEGRS